MLTYDTVLQTVRTPYPLSHALHPATVNTVVCLRVRRWIGWHFCWSFVPVTAAAAWRSSLICQNCLKASATRSAAKPRRPSCPWCVRACVRVYAVMRRPCHSRLSMHTHVFVSVSVPLCVHGQLRKLSSEPLEPWQLTMYACMLFCREGMTASVPRLRHTIELRDERAQQRVQAFNKLCACIDAVTGSGAVLTSTTARVVRELLLPLQPALSPRLASRIPDYINSACHEHMASYAMQSKHFMDGLSGCCTVARTELRYAMANVLTCAVRILAMNDDNLWNYQVLDRAFASGRERSDRACVFVFAMLARLQAAVSVFMQRWRPVDVELLQASDVHNTLLRRSWLMFSDSFVAGGLSPSQAAAGAGGAAARQLSLTALDTRMLPYRQWSFPAVRVKLMSGLLSTGELIDHINVRILWEHGCGVADALNAVVRVGLFVCRRMGLCVAGCSCHGQTLTQPA